MKIEESPFGEIAEERLIWESDAVAAFLDGYPVSEGHALVVPRRVVAALENLSEKEETELWKVARKVRRLLVERYRPNGFNIGVNEGIAAGQTITHAHIHIIPRYEGDCSDPRGGIRLIFPEKARYWKD